MKKTAFVLIIVFYSNVVNSQSNKEQKRFNKNMDQLIEFANSIGINNTPKYDQFYCTKTPFVYKNCEIFHDDLNIGDVVWDYLSADSAFKKLPIIRSNAAPIYSDKIHDSNYDSAITVFYIKIFDPTAHAKWFKNNCFIKYSNEHPQYYLSHYYSFYTSHICFIETKKIEDAVIKENTRIYNNYLTKAVNGSSIDCKVFLEKYPLADHFLLVTKLMREKEISEENLCFNSAANGSINDKKNYLMLYSNGKYKEEVAKMLEQQYYQIALSGDLSDLNMYLSIYPDGEYISKIILLKDSILEKKAYEKALKRQNSDLDNYLKTYPNGKYYSEVLNIKLQMEEELYQKAINGVVNDWNIYLETYPEGQHSKEISELKLNHERKELEIIDLSNESWENSLENIMNYTREKRNLAELNPEKYGLIIDLRDNREYGTVKIGNQWWMAENLRYDYSCEQKVLKHLDNKSENIIYGLYYDILLSDKICPLGWTVPSVNDFTILMENVPDGKELIFGGTSGFNAVLGGFYMYGASKDSYETHWINTPRSGVFLSRESGTCCAGDRFVYALEVGYGIGAKIAYNKAYGGPPYLGYYNVRCVKKNYSDCSFSLKLVSSKVDDPYYGYTYEVYCGQLLIRTFTVATNIDSSMGDIVFDVWIEPNVPNKGIYYWMDGELHYNGKTYSVSGPKDACYKTLLLFVESEL